MVNQDNIYLSFIIPAYNAENYLNRAVSSIYGGLVSEDFEVIIVENGSSDQTVSIALSLQKKYGDSLRLLHSEKGVSKARNMGLAAARGRWIMFLDADDAYDISGLNHASEVVREESADFYCFSYLTGKKKISLLSEKEYAWFSGGSIEKCKCHMIENPTIYLQVWSKFFKKELIDKNHMRFDEELRLAEDSDFTIQYLKCCEKIMWTKDVLYLYNTENEKSVMRRHDGTKAEEYICSVRKTQKRINNETKAIKKAYCKYVLMHFYIIFVREVFNLHNKISFKRKVRCMKQLSKGKIFQDNLQALSVSDFMTIRMLPAFLLRCHLYHCAAIAFYARAWKHR